jgi:glucose/mannose-6-phosphate isomerase
VIDAIKLIVLVFLMKIAGKTSFLYSRCITVCMADPAGIIRDIKEQEKTKWFKGRRKLEKEEAIIPKISTVLNDYSFHIQNSLKIAGEYKVLEEFDRVVIAGVGANAVTGELLASYLSFIPELKFEVDVANGDMLPSGINEKTLVFLLSYTGNEEEAVTIYRQMIRKNTRIIGITSGGRLHEILLKNNTNRLLVPKNLPDCAALPYMFFTVLKILDNSKKIPEQRDIIEDTIGALKNEEYKKIAEDIAKKIGDKIPLFYSTASFSAVADRWKTQANVIAKTPAFRNTFPGLCYNEIEVYTNNRKDIYPLIISDEEENKLNLKSITVSKRVIKATGNSIAEIAIRGNNRLSRMLSAVYIGDWVAYHLSEENKVKDTTERLVEKYIEECRHEL